jgi:hypothetical protein
MVANRSGVDLKSLAQFDKNYDLLKEWTIKESAIAIAETRQDFFETLSDVLGSTPPSGGAPSPLPSDYAIVWAELTEKWLNYKISKGLRQEIGTATQRLKGYLLILSQSLGRTKSGINISVNEASYIWDISRQAEDGSSRAKGSGVSENPLAKIFFMEFGRVERPFVYPTLRWFQAQLSMQDDMLIKPYIQALGRAKAIVYGGRP